MSSVLIACPKSEKRITAQCIISASKINEEDTPIRVSCKALIDTGAMRTCISEGIVNYLNLKPTGAKVALTSANGQTKDCDCYTMDIELPNGIKFEYQEIPCLMKGVEMIIGMDILGKGTMTILGDGHQDLYIMRFDIKD